MNDDEKEAMICDMARDIENNIIGHGTGHTSTDELLPAILSNVVGGALPDSSNEALARFQIDATTQHSLEAQNAWRTFSLLLPFALAARADTEVDLVGTDETGGESNPSADSRRAADAWRSCVREGTRERAWL